MTVTQLRLGVTVTGVAPLHGITRKRMQAWACNCLSGVPINTLALQPAVQLRTNHFKVIDWSDDYSDRRRQLGLVYDATVVSMQIVTTFVPANKLNRLSSSFSHTFRSAVLWGFKIQWQDLMMFKLNGCMLEGQLHVLKSLRVFPHKDQYPQQPVAEYT